MVLTTNTCEKLLPWKGPHSVRTANANYASTNPTSQEMISPTKLAVKCTSTFSWHDGVSWCWGNTPRCLHNVVEIAREFWFWHHHHQNNQWGRCLCFYLLWRLPGVVPGCIKAYEMCPSTEACWALNPIDIQMRWEDSVSACWSRIWWYACGTSKQLCFSEKNAGGLGPVLWPA